jgi:transcriptional regulator with XRE-family HTH domain
MNEVKRLRRLKGLSQVELAELAGVSAYTVTEIETGHREPRGSTLRKLAAALDVEVADFFPKAPAPPSLDATAVGAGVYEEPAEAALRIAGVQGHADKLSAVWIQEAKFHVQDSRAVPSHRTFERSCAVTVLYQQYFGAVEVLQRDAMKKGLDPDMTTWEPRLKQLLIDSGAAVRALSELYALVARSSASAEEDRENFQARLEEFDAGLPAFLAQDPAWGAAVEKSRADAGLT